MSCVKNLIEKVKEKRKLVREYKKNIQAIEELLGFRPLKIIPGLEAAFWNLPGLKLFSAPILWNEPVNPLRVAIHEIRHYVQIQNFTSYLKLETIPSVLQEEIKKEIEESIEELKKTPKKFIGYHLDEEIDARIVEIIGEQLLKEQAIEKFRELITSSKIVLSS